MICKVKTSIILLTVFINARKLQYFLSITNVVARLGLLLTLHITNGSNKSAAMRNDMVK